MWDAPWRIAPDRVQPGSASGSSAQESWHGTKLAQCIRKTHQAPHALVADLQKFVRGRLSELGPNCPAIRDWPSAGKDLDLFLVRGDVELKREGRSTAIALAESGFMRHVTIGEDTWVLVPRTLWEEVRAPRIDGKRKRKTKQYQPLDLEPLDAPTSHAMATLFVDDAEHEVGQCLVIKSAFSVH